jgi:hypothetical protein
VVDNSNVCPMKGFCLTADRLRKSGIWVAVL